MNFKFQVIKRDGRLDDFRPEKIIGAVYSAERAMNRVDDHSSEYATEVCNRVGRYAEGQETLSVEDIQTCILDYLKERDPELRAVYEKYRNERSVVRERKEKIYRHFGRILSSDPSCMDIMRENANVRGGTPMGRMLRIGSEASKYYYLSNPDIIPHETAELHRKGIIHIHDLDFYGTSINCLQIPLSDILKRGFSTGHGSVRQPKGIRTAAALACIVLQSNQNDMFGGQSIPDFEYALAPYVKMTFDRYYAEYSNDFNKAVEMTWRETYQAMEALIHNLNTMASRAGAQVPFSSINYGTGTTFEQRMVISCILHATDAGLGHGETPIFPVQVFKVKAGVNYDYGDPNRDLFELSVKVSAKRLFPNWEFLDAPFNLQYYRPGHIETEVATMGCRTRVMADRFGKDITPGRGNLSFTSINLPRIALMTRGKGTDCFFSELDYITDKVIEQLVSRYKIQASLRVRNLPFLMGQGLYEDSRDLGPDDTVEKAVRHGTLGIGFVGLAEALVALTGHHHGETDEAEQLGLDIVRHLRLRADLACEKYNLNFSLIGSPAESTAGAFLRADRNEYGVIPGVTDKEYYTNSHHIPVNFHISAYRKIKLEAPFHELENGGHITYVELDGDTAKNPEAVMSVVKCMHDSGIGYGAVNHPVDRDPVCGYTGVIGDTCPLCGRHDGEAVSEEKLRQIKKNIL